MTSKLFNVFNETMNEMKNESWPSEALRTATELVAEDGKAAKLSVIDVGAHQGETFQHFSDLIEGEFDYYGFEPNPESFTELEGVVSPQRDDRRSVTCFPAAVGASAGSVLFRVAKASEVSGVLVPESELLIRVASGDHELKEAIDVPQICIDDFLAKQKIASVNILKIDTEGYDLEVIRGAQASLRRGIVDVVVCEVFFVRYRENQAYFWDIASVLAELGYSFVNLFDSRNTGQGRLYTANAIWVSPRLSVGLGYL